VKEELYAATLDLMAANAFENALDTISGTSSLASEDPVWIELFQCCADDPYFISDANRISRCCESFVQNNLETNNLSRLLQKSSDRLRILSKQKLQRNHEFRICCATLHICCMLIHHFVTSIPVFEVFYLIVLS
jgi:hypothetical protein